MDDRRIQFSPVWLKQKGGWGGGGDEYNAGSRVCSSWAHKIQSVCIGKNSWVANLQGRGGG